jgi:ribosomal protein S18 acetylase RimI-like enzyme
MATSDPWLTLRRTYEDAVKLLRDPAKEVYVAQAGNELRGFTVLDLRGPLGGYIQTVAVAPAWRNQGTGARLVAFAEQRIFRESPNVFLCVSSFNTRAQKLYARLGYEVVGELRNFVISGHSEILMRKTLGPRAEFQAPA